MLCRQSGPASVLCTEGARLVCNTSTKSESMCRRTNAAHLVISVDKVHHMFYLQYTGQRHLVTWKFDGLGGSHWKHGGMDHGHTCQHC